MFSKLSIKWRIVLIGVAPLVLIGGLLFSLYYHDTKARFKEQYVDKARSVLLNAEAVREEMSAKWDVGLFSTEQLSEWAKAGEIDKIMESVPVISAMKATMASSKEGGYEFRVPKHHPRNPENEPDPVEAAAIEHIKKHQLDEYHVVDESRNAIRYFRPVRLTQECMACHGDPHMSASLWGNDQGLDPTGAKMEGWQVGDVHGAFEIIQSLDEADAELASAMWQVGGVIGAFVLGSGILLYFLVTRSISNPIRETVEAFNVFADGDLRRDLVVGSQDEVGQLRSAINTLMSKLRGMVESMKECSFELASGATELTQTAAQLGDGTRKTTAGSSAVAAAAEEMAVNMNNMAGSTDQMSSNVKAVAAAIEEMTASISEVATNAERTAGVADEAANLAAVSQDRIGQLETAAQAIGKVIETIQDIAEQTNLLALNATIEAARAGDAGKGFAVVATEVKELAKQTASATEDIRRRIEGIQSSSNEAIGAIDEISEVVKKVNEASRTIASAVEEQSITTKEIAQNVTDAAGAADVVSSNVNETAIATREVTQNIADVDHNAKQTAEDAERTRQAGTNMSRLSEQLQTYVNMFNASTKALDTIPIKAAHNLWKTKLADVLSGQQTLDPSEVSLPTECAFGKWYHSEGKERGGHLPIFAIVGERHDKVHGMAREIAQLCKDGDISTATERFVELENVTAALFDALEQLSSEMEASKAATANA